VLDQSGYFNAVCIVVKAVFNFEPRPVVTGMMATAIPAAINPYSMAVTAVSSRRKLMKFSFKVGSP
jgi:hypothetical protein